MIRVFLNATVPGSAVDTSMAPRPKLPNPPLGGCGKPGHVTFTGDEGTCHCQTCENAVGTMYVAGPMRGHPLFNFPAFDDAADRLRRAGYHVISPADLDHADGFSEYADTEDADKRREFAVRDVIAIAKCNRMALLPGWEQSQGVAFEKAVAEFIGIPVKEVDLWLKRVV